MGIAGIGPGPNLSEPQVYPYLLRGLRIERPNQVWSIDITYIRLSGGWMYLVAILDWFARYVVAWELDQTLEIPFVLRSVDQALAQNQPEIWNSDQGSHFTSPQYTQRLLDAGIPISMNGRRRATDNIFNERLWRSVKYEEVYLNDYQSPRETRFAISRYLNFYNHERPHQSLAYCTPGEVYCPDESPSRRGIEFIALDPLPGLNAGSRGLNVVTRPSALATALGSARVGLHRSSIL
jgi:putative transposase